MSQDSRRAGQLHNPGSRLGMVGVWLPVSLSGSYCEARPISRERVHTREIWVWAPQTPVQTCVQKPLALRGWWTRMDGALHERLPPPRRSGPHQERVGMSTLAVGTQYPAASLSTLPAPCFASFPEVRGERQVPGVPTSSSSGSLGHRRTCPAHSLPA